MGYSEIYCHICGVSFNINRIRTVEHVQAGAAYQPKDVMDDSEISCADVCITDKGCFYVAPQSSTAGSMNESDDDDSWATVSDSGDEDMDVHEDDSGSTSEDRGSASEEDAGQDSFDSTTSTKSLLMEDKKQTVGDIVLRPFDGDDDEAGEHEHIAGPHCEDKRGYHSDRFTLDQLRGCRLSQALVRKNNKFSSDDGIDEPFERDPAFKWFLTGLTDYMPSRDMDHPVYFPSRHEGEDGGSGVENFHWDRDEPSPGMPFHPTCLEVFRRASIKRLDRIDYDLLMSWYEKTSDHNTFHAYNNNKDEVGRANDQWWQHRRGQEYLAANPCHIPGWADVIDGCVVDRSIGLRECTDTFSALPTSIRDMIIDELLPDFTDMANLRRASRTFRSMAQSTWRQRLLEKHPWVWEVWSELPYSYWTGTSPDEMKKEEKERQESWTEKRRAIEVLREEAGEAGENAAAIRDLEAQLDQLMNRKPIEEQAISAPTLLGRKDVDWFKLCTALSKSGTPWGLGLRNRQRIWERCDDILDY